MFASKTVIKKPQYFLQFSLAPKIRSSQPSGLERHIVTFGLLEWAIRV